MKPLDHHYLDRLVLIRYAFGRAATQARQPHPLSTLSLLELHDAVEWFLLLVSEVYNAKKVPASAKLMEYWQIIEESDAGERPGSYQQMKRLADARNGLKHRGILPAQNEVESLLIRCEAFFEDETAHYFEIPFDHISMSSLIQDPLVKSIYSNAEQLAASGDFRQATIEICKAFFIAHHERTGHLKASAEMVDMRLFGSQNAFVEQTKDILSEIITVVSDLSEEVGRLMIGQDHATVKRFFSISPSFRASFNRQAPVGFSRWDFDPSEDDYRFCERFTLSYLLANQTIQV